MVSVQCCRSAGVEDGPTLQTQEPMLLSGFAGVHQGLPGFGMLQFLKVAAFVSK